MTHLKKVLSADDAWDTGELGNDEAHIRRSRPEDEAAVDDTLDLRMISIRLQRELIRELKFIAKYRGVGYQPLMRDVLSRWSRGELLLIANEIEKREQANSALEKTSERKRKRA